MIILTASSNDGIYKKNSYQLDTSAELDELKEMQCAPGSDAIVLETADVYIKNSQNEWVVL